jgi:ribonucleoside-triphosphate reductase
MTAEIKVRKKIRDSKDVTKFSLLVESGSEETYSKFDEQNIYNAIVNELELDASLAKEITDLVVKKIVKIVEDTTLKIIDTSLIRSLVNVTLLEKGLTKELKSKEDIILSSKDIQNIIEQVDNNNGNTNHCPESINHTIAERILKEWQLNNVFSEDVKKAHLNNFIYCHDLSSAHRVYCSGHSLEYVKLNGIKNIPTILSTSKPANSAWTLARHLCSITQFYAGMYAGAIGWEAVNLFFAPMTTGWSHKKLVQLAQTIIYDLSQLAGAKGGQTAFTDFNIYMNVPDIYKETPAVGKSGQYIGTKRKEGIKLGTKDLVFFSSIEEIKKTKGFRMVKYKDFEDEIISFANAIFEVIGEGDALGVPFAFPKINLHINNEVFNKRKWFKGKGVKLTKDGKSVFEKNYDEVIRLEKEGYISELEENKAGVSSLNLATEASSRKGCPYFIFDRGFAQISACCRLSHKFKEEDSYIFKHPEKLNFAGIQNVSINLPSTALVVKGDITKFYIELEKRMDLAMKAHHQKAKYIEYLMGLKNTPLKYYNTGMNNEQYVDLRKGSYLIGIVGLNECVYNLIGKQLHEGQDAYLLGLEIISFMNFKVRKLSEESGLNVKCEESPGEILSGRMAFLDYEKYGNKAFVKKNGDDVYYTNSIHFAYDSDVTFTERILKQSNFHSLIDAGAIIHLWVGERLPKPEAIFDLVKKTYENTECAQFVVNPSFTTCNDCKTTTVGVYEECPVCKGTNIFGLDRITGYYVKRENFNKGKVAEFKDRNTKAYQI